MIGAKAASVADNEASEAESSAPVPTRAVTVYRRTKSKMHVELFYRPGRLSVGCDPFPLHSFNILYNTTNAIHIRGVFSGSRPLPFRHVPVSCDLDKSYHYVTLLI